MAGTSTTASRTLFPQFLHPSPVPHRRRSQTSLLRCSSNNGGADIVSILEQRGLLEAVTSDALRSRKPITAYCGFDPTAPSLHLGNLLALVVLSWFRRSGHRVIALLGGATARVGDPSGKSLDRPLLDPQTLSSNSAAISRSISRILGSDSDPVTVLDNYEWWRDFRLLDFLSRVGRFARVGTMIRKDTVKRRLEASEQGLSYAEFTYQLLQGYDFLHLFDEMRVNVQIGGSDQWGNITAGTDLIRKILRSDEAYGLTFPLLLKSDGTKFGKSEEGAVWLDPQMLSPYRFYQHLFSVADSDVVRYLKMLTFLEIEEIDGIAAAMGSEPNLGQRRLAEEVTRFVHGEEGLGEAVRATEAIRAGDWEAIGGVAGDVPSCSMERRRVVGSSVVELSVAAGLFESKSAAKRVLKQGGFYLNNARVESESRRVEEGDVAEGNMLLLSSGKKNKLLVTVS